MEENLKSVEKMSDDTTILSKTSETLSSPENDGDNKCLKADIKSLCQIPQMKAAEENSIEPLINDLKCLMVEDTSVNSAPLHLRAILNHFENENLSQGELFYLLVYGVALEMGFVCEKSYEKMKQMIVLLPTSSTFHSKNVLQLSKLKPLYSKSPDSTRFTLRLYSIMNVLVDTDDDKLHSLLTGFVTGDLMIVTLSPIGNVSAVGFSCALSIPRHVLNIHPTGMPLYTRFLKMDAFSRELRNNIFVPMRNQQLSLLQAAIYPSLDAMPAELYDNIFKFLNVNHINILANVNHNLYSLAGRNKHKNRIEEHEFNYNDRSDSVLLDLH